MVCTADDIQRLISEVWAPSLELDMYAVDYEHGERPYTAVLEATGSWQGHIVVRATDSFGRGVAAKMFGMPRPQVGTEEAADAVAELANVVGGNLKSLLDEGEVDLGLPSIDTDVEQLSGKVVARSVLQAGPGFEVTISVVQSVPAQV